VPQNGKRKGKDSVVVEIQGPQAVSRQKGLRNQQLAFDGMGIQEAVRV